MNKGMEKLPEYAVQSLKKMVKGYTVNEKRVIYVTNSRGKRSIKSEQTVAKYFPPDLKAVRYVVDRFAHLLEGRESGDGADLSLLSTEVLEELEKAVKDL